LKTYIIIPAFNEASHIPELLNQLLLLNYPVILVDDGSTDDTYRISKSFGIVSVHHLINLGQGAALQTGMEAARRLDADFVVHFDADGQHDAADIENLLIPLRNGEADIILGSRFLEKKPSGMTLSRKMVLKTARWINYLFSGVLLSDAHNGLRALNRKALQELQLKQAGMAHASEILGILKKKSLRYKEIPVHIRYTPYSKHKGQGISNAINIIFHLLFKRN
jgi:polyprenyl-phospho-N-acetylgalactosaminyl synthase